MKSYSERLKYAMFLKNNMSQSELARLTKIKPQAIQYLCKKGTRSVHTVKIAEVLGINPKWLDDGDGEMEPAAILPSKSPPMVKPESNAEPSRPPVVGDEEWKALPPKARALVEELITKTSSGDLTDSHVKIIHNMMDELSKK